jgi:hypothetical protein
MGGHKSLLMVVVWVWVQIRRKGKCWAVVGRCEGNWAWEVKLGVKLRSGFHNIHNLPFLTLVDPLNLT